MEKLHGCVGLCQSQQHFSHLDLKLFWDLIRNSGQNKNSHSLQEQKSNCVIVFLNEVN